MAKKQIEQTEIEAPYELPEGWKWCRLGELFSHVTGKALKKENQKGIKKRYITTSNIYWGTFDFSEIREMYFEENELDKCTAKKGDLLVCNGGDIGRSAIWNYDYDICLQNHVSKLRKLNNTVLPQFYYYLMLFYKNSGFLNGKGIGISSLSAKDLLNLTVPVSTLEEQQRIVNRIETLFAKLDQAKEKAQNVVDTFETRKASILHKAFTGELTKKWREENGVGDDSWEEKTLEEVCDFITKGTTPKKEDMNIGSGDVPYIKVYNLCFDTQLDFTIDPTFVKRESHENFLARSITFPGDVLMNIVGPPFGKVSIVPDSYPEWNINQAIARFRCQTSLNNRYLAYYLISPKTIESMSRQIKTTAGQQNLTLEICRNISILVPSIEEQIEVVKILEVVIEKESKAKEAAEAVLEQIDLLKKSILARAFRGEL